MDKMPRSIYFIVIVRYRRNLQNAGKAITNDGGSQERSQTFRLPALTTQLGEV